MHPSVSTWVNNQVKIRGIAANSTLELGALNVNGSVRGYFTGPYIGVDKQAGNGVDKVMDANQLEFEDESFDTVVSTEMLEHDPSPWLTFQEIYRVLKPGGKLLLTTRGPEFPHHDYGGDFYRYTNDALAHLARYAGLVNETVEPDPFPGHSGGFLYAEKPR